MAYELLGTSEHSVSRRRYAAVTFAATDTVISTLASAQPASADGLVDLPDDARVRFPMEVESLIELRKDDPRSGLPPDDLIIDGQVYDIARWEECPALGPIPRHWYVVALAVHADSAVIVRTVTTPAPGLAELWTAETNSDLTIHHPRPWVSDYITRNPEPGGIYLAGDRKVERISRRYTRAQLEPASNTLWMIDGEPHILVSLEPRPFDWCAVVRRARQP